MDRVAIFRISNHKMVAYGLGAISDDSEDIDAAAAEPKRKSEEKICVRSSSSNRRPNKRKRRQQRKGQFCEGDRGAAAEKQKVLEEVKSYQEKLEERVSHLEATLLLVTSRQIGVEDVEVSHKERATLEKEMLQRERRGKGVETRGMGANAEQEEDTPDRAAEQEANADRAEQEGDTAAGQQEVDADRAAERQNIRKSNQMPHSAEINQDQERSKMMKYDPSVRKSRDEDTVKDSELEGDQFETNQEKKSVKKSHDDDNDNDDDNDDDNVEESELEDLLLDFKPGEEEEDVLEIADDDVTKLLEEDDFLTLPRN